MVGEIGYNFRDNAMNSFTVFVCGSYSDLSQEREGVLDAIRRVKLQYDSMDFFGGRTDRPIMITTI
jgi:hypothetical protein